METRFWIILCCGIQIFGANGEPFCSDAYAGVLRYSDYLTWTCSNCLTLIMKNRIDVTTNISKSNKLYLKCDNSVQYEPSVANPPHDEVCRSYLTGKECTKWYKCCVAARNCCERAQERENTSNGNISHCPLIWDGVGCWGPTPEYTAAEQRCPSYYVTKPCKSNRTCAMAHKLCNRGGTWYVNQSTNRTYTHYKACDGTRSSLNKTQMSTDPLVASKYVMIVCQAISLGTLVMAVILFVLFRSYLRRDENARFKYNLNVNHFVSFLFLSLIMIIIYAEIYKLDGDTQPTNKTKAESEDKRRPEKAIVLDMLMWYFRISTCWWFFCQGVYLRNVLVNPMSKKRIWPYMIIGWGIPLLSVSLYVIVESSVPLCKRFTTRGSLQHWLALIAPYLVALALNLILLITVQVELMRHFAHTRDEDRAGFVKQGIKLNFTLIPVFGVQVLILIHRPQEWFAYDVIEGVLVGLQGFLVVLVHCFFTKEVKIACERYRAKRSVSVFTSGTKSTKTTRVSGSSSGGLRTSIQMQGLGSDSGRRAENGISNPALYTSQT